MRAGTRSLAALECDLPALQRSLRLAGLLQTSLELENILQLFADSVRETLPFDGFSYRNQEIGMQFDFGVAARCRCAFRPQIESDDLGEILFTRQTTFSLSEKAQLKNSIQQLRYPLRNALLYQRALLAAQLDSLTGIHNRAAMDRCLDRERELAQRQNYPLSLLIVDIDHFKHINDSYGHSAGDSVLRDLASCMQASMRACDMLFRYGGEEFALILTGVGAEGACQMAERLRAAVAAARFRYDERVIGLTVSIGVATLNPQDSSKSLFNKADVALYQAKQSGRNQVQGAPRLNPCLR